MVVVFKILLFLVAIVYKATNIVRHVVYMK